MSGKASRMGLIGCVGALLWLVAASSAHAAPTWLPAFDPGFPARQVAVITVTDAEHNAGRPATLSFRIVRR